MRFSCSGHHWRVEDIYESILIILVFLFFYREGASHLKEMYHVDEVLIFEDMMSRKYRPCYIAIPVMLLLYLFWCCTLIRDSSTTQSDREFSSIHLDNNNCYPTDIQHVLKMKKCQYNSTYPLTRVDTIPEGERYRISIIADLDEKRSKVIDKRFTWRSYLKRGYFTILRNGQGYKVEWDSQITLTSNVNEKGRGLELSELSVFNGKLYTVDDRTGIIYQIIGDEVVPWVILMDGDGSKRKGFKAEWMTVKDGALYVGGLGKEWTTRSGVFVNYHPLFIKTVDQFGAVAHHNWTENYLKIRWQVGIRFPGYMIHEAVMWSSVRQRWYFLPRRMSNQGYDDVADEKRGTNVLISAASDFTDLRVVYVGNLDPTHGFSSFKFVPGTRDRIAVALKTREVEGQISSYVIVFNIDSGAVLMQEQFVANDKFEGIEFT